MLNCMLTSMHDPICLDTLSQFIAMACFAKRTLYACFVDLQKAYDVVRHDMEHIVEHVEFIGVAPPMLAAIKSLCCNEPFP